jgi:hypothetical protein
MSVDLVKLLLVKLLSNYEFIFKSEKSYGENYLLQDLEEFVYKYPKETDSKKFNVNKDYSNVVGIEGKKVLNTIPYVVSYYQHTINETYRIPQVPTDLCELIYFYHEHGLDLQLLHEWLRINFSNINSIINCVVKCPTIFESNHKKNVFASFPDKNDNDITSLEKIYTNIDNSTTTKLKAKELDILSNLFYKLFYTIKNIILTSISINPIVIKYLLLIAEKFPDPQIYDVPQTYKGKSIIDKLNVIIGTDMNKATIEEVHNILNTILNTKDTPKSHNIINLLWLCIREHVLQYGGKVDDNYSYPIITEDNTNNPTINMWFNIYIKLKTYVEESIIKQKYIKYIKYKN